MAPERPAPSPRHLGTPARPKSRPGGRQGPARRPERDTRNAILALLRAHGIAAWPTGVGAFRAADRFIRMGTKGMSDIVGILPHQAWPCSDKRCLKDMGGEHPHFTLEGLFLAIEVKSPHGRVSPEQTAFLQTVVRAGGIGFVAHSVDEVADKLGLRK